MFLSGKRWYGRGGEQKASGPFLMIFNIKSGGDLKAFVKSLVMTQLGHFMMSTIKVKFPDGVERQITLSGCYGSDGLPIGADEQEKGGAWWKYAHPVPPDLVKEFWHPKWQGHNSCGSEGPLMRNWAIANIKTLRKLLKIT